MTSACRKNERPQTGKQQCFPVLFYSRRKVYIFVAIGVGWLAGYYSGPIQDVVELAENLVINESLTTIADGKNCRTKRCLKDSCGSHCADAVDVQALRSMREGKKKCGINV